MADHTLDDTLAAVTAEDAGVDSRHRIRGRRRRERAYLSDAISRFRKGFSATSARRAATTSSAKINTALNS
jgi:hypothetical protein